MKNLMLVVLAIGIGSMIYQSLFGLRDPEWYIELAEDDAFTLASTILTQGEVRRCADLKIARQYPRNFEIDVICNNSKRHTLTYHPSFQVDGRHASFTWLERAYCLQNANGDWDQAFLSLKSAREAAIVKSNTEGERYRVFAAHHYDVGGTVISEDGNWTYDRFIGGASNQIRRGCELTELTDEYEEISGFE